VINLNNNYQLNCIKKKTNVFDSENLKSVRDDVIAVDMMSLNTQIFPLFFTRFDFRDANTWRALRRFEKNSTWHV